MSAQEPRPRYTFPSDCSPRIAVDGDYVAATDYDAARAQRSADVDALNLKDEQIMKLSRELEVAEAVRGDHAALISSLTARLEQCERDARDISRYHFLRALSDSEWELFGQIPEYEMDAAIDAAMLPKEG